jgi:hypothetical protein
MNKLRPWLLLVLVFVAGFAGGVVVTRGVVRHTVRQALGNPDFLRTRLERRLTFALRLDPQQRLKVHEILEHTQADLKTLRSEFQPRFVEVVKRAETQISADLTPEQQRRFEKFQQDNRAWWPAR